MSGLQEEVIWAWEVATCVEAASAQEVTAMRESVEASVMVVEARADLAEWEAQ
jgi:hypothetical protein